MKNKIYEFLTKFFSDDDVAQAIEDDIVNQNEDLIDNDEGVINDDVKTELLNACLEKNVKKECCDDVLAIAKNYCSDCVDISLALDIVLEKYPVFVENNNSFTTTGKKTVGENVFYDGVKSAFLKRNPNIKI